MQETVTILQQCRGLLIAPDTNKVESNSAVSAVDAPFLNNRADASWLFAAAMEKRENPSTSFVLSVSTRNVCRIVCVTGFWVIVVDGLCCSCCDLGYCCCCRVRQKTGAMDQRFCLRGDENCGTSSVAFRALLSIERFLDCICSRNSRLCFTSPPPKWLPKGRLMHGCTFASAGPRFKHRSNVSTCRCSLRRIFSQGLPHKPPPEPSVGSILRAQPSTTRGFSSASGLLYHHHFLGQGGGGSLPRQ